MKYMTPDLLARFRSADEDVADRAADEWEVNCQEYNKHLESIQKRLPRSVRRSVHKLLRDYCLHDAQVLTLTQDEHPNFSIFLRPRGQGNGYVELRYSLLRLKVNRHKSLEGDGAPLRWWLYDEFTILNEHFPVCTHSILFTGGWEFQVTFSSLHVRKIRKFVLPPTTADASASEAEDVMELELQEA